MKQYFQIHRLPLVASALLALAIAGCGDDANVGPSGNTPDTARVVTSFNVQAMAGTTPLALGSEITSESGVQYKVSTLRFYISQFMLLDSAGNTVAATLADSAGNPLKYDVAFYDLANPSSQKINILARKGSYRGVSFSIGVPVTTASGDSLNHANASEHTYPLDVDNDMYWGWNPGYVFFKIEGSALVGTTWQNLVYHIGGDNRLMKPRVEAPFTVAQAGTTRGLVINVNRLFVTPAGGSSPNMTGSPAERVVHGGAAADSMAVNVAKSGFITLKP